MIRQPHQPDPDDSQDESSGPVPRSSGSNSGSNRSSSNRSSSNRSSSNSSSSSRRGVGQSRKMILEQRRERHALRNPETGQPNTNPFSQAPDSVQTQATLTTPDSLHRRCKDWLHQKHKEVAFVSVMAAVGTAIGAATYVYYGEPNVPVKAAVGASGACVSLLFMYLSCHFKKG